MATISLVIIAQNEERTVGQVLSSAAPLASEIIFVDSGSTDKTIEIAKSFGVKFYHQEWLGYSAQKNYAIDLASSDWILSLDADEVLTPDLVAEIQKLLGQPDNPDICGYTIPRVLHINDKPVRHGGFYPDAQLRLFRRGKGRFKDRLVHEAVALDGRIGRLRHDMLHYAYKDTMAFAEAMDKYARLSAQHYYSNSYYSWKIHPLNELVHPCWTFGYRFLLRGGFLDGMLGLKLNLIYSNYVRKKITYLRELVEAQGPP